MDKDRIKGKIENAAGRVKRQAGEWTGDDKAQAEGLAEQAKGKAREGVGKAKDAIRDAADDLRRRRESEQEIDRENRDERDEEAA
ncbi:MAG TPA: CsbD family protein [Candidatus Angelobacter sp.]|nr:CsbD family protein [Candidatus Angelobacter sp.]